MSGGVTLQVGQESTRAEIVAAFQRTARLDRANLFADARLTPVTAVAEAGRAAPGWVGERWSGGTLMIGINPGGGGDDYRPNPSDDELYDLLRRFRAADPDAAAGAFAELSAGWQRIQRGHNIWRIIAAILAATGEGEDQIAFLNILPFRTRMDKPAPAATLRRAWERASGSQVAALRPRRIIALGKKAWDVLARFPMPEGAELILFKRGIGDSYIPAESQQLLRELAEQRDEKG